MNQIFPTYHFGHPHHRFVIPGRDFRQDWSMNSFALLTRRFVSREHETVRTQHTFIFPASSPETRKFAECHSLLFYLFQILYMSIRYLLFYSGVFHASFFLLVGWLRRLLDIRP